MMIYDFSNPVEEECLEEVVKSLLDLIVLTLLYKNPQHGYKLIKNIHRKFGVLLSPGTLYPFLYNLKEEDLVDVDEVKRKKIYSLTPGGKQEVLSLYKHYRRNCRKVFNFIDDNLDALIKVKPH